ncbi:DNA-binding transcriptional regulator GbsR (MarR family) [Psychroflexus sp. MBR-150]
MPLKINFTVLNKGNTLIEELTSHFEVEYNLPPLAAKIYSLLILSREKYITFEELINFTNASKSSVSCQLNYLIDEGRVDYIYKEDNRKRYFKTKCDYLRKTLELHLIKIKREIAMLTKVIEYKKEQDMSQGGVSIVENHLKTEKENIIKTINKLKQTSYNLEHHEK